jgi:hypothetical protein
VQSAEGGEQIGFDKFQHCRGRKRNLVVDTLGFPCARTVTSAVLSDPVAGRDVLTQVKDRHPHLVKGWIDGGYANAVDSKIIPWAAGELHHAPGATSMSTPTFAGPRSHPPTTGSPSIDV